MADKVKETPGPWKALLDPGWGWCVKAGKKYLAFKLTEADAQIMAASWEMLQFVEDQMKATNCICRIQSKLKGTGFESDLECTHCRAKNLLAKARGE
jgi:hypothetical protein